jgi:phosphatidate cytidylyltransferase
MKKLIERLLLFFVGLPLIIASVFFLPQYHYLALHIEILAICALAILEMRNLLKTKLAVLPVSVTLLIGMIIPAASFAFAVFGLPERVITSSIAIAAVLALVIEFGLSFSGSFDKAIARTASSFAVIMYPGYLVMYLAIMTVWHDAGTILSLFFLMVFGCDSIAWLFGVLLGKNNRGLVPASPKKSIAGFIGGFTGSILPGIAFYVYFPAVFGGSLWKILLLGVMTAAASIVGDIIESVLKRSAGVKDSGSIIPGRGGVLDSIDSILLAAPVFYILCDFLYGFGA